MGRIIASVRASDTLGPAPGAVHLLCHFCRAECLASPSSLAIKETDPKALIVCNRCLPEVTAGAELEAMSLPTDETDLKKLIQTTPQDRRCAHGFAWCPECDRVPSRDDAKDAPGEFLAGGEDGWRGEDEG